MSSEDQSSKIKSVLERCTNKYPSFAYPWDGLEEWLDKTDRSKLPLIGYGSLINQQSAGRTINVDGSAKRQAVKAFGAKRVFNYRMPTKLLEERYQTPLDSREVAALNCEVTSAVSDEFNGILTHVEFERLDQLREREKHYSLKPVVYHHWDGNETGLRVAYILELLPDNTVPNNPYDSTILPHKEYTKLCQEGALAVSKTFLQHFSTTCLLADKKTSLSEYQSEQGESQDGQ